MFYNFEDFFHQSAFVFPISRTKKSNFLHQFWNSFWNLSEICFFPLSCRIALVVLSSASLDGGYWKQTAQVHGNNATFTFVWHPSCLEFCYCKHRSTQVHCNKATFTFALTYMGRKSVTPFLSSVLLRKIATVSKAFIVLNDETKRKNTFRNTDYGESLEKVRQPCCPLSRPIWPHRYRLCTPSSA